VEGHARRDGLPRQSLGEGASPAKADPCGPFRATRATPLEGSHPCEPLPHRSSCTPRRTTLHSLRSLLCHPPTFRVFRVFRGSPVVHPEPCEGSIRVRDHQTKPLLPTKRTNGHKWIDPIPDTLNTEVTESAEEKCTRRLMHDLEGESPDAPLLQVEDHVPVTLSVRPPASRLRSCLCLMR